jgi:glycosyltransferase A (GT-A) superfamily protein (DUF2064 family)
LNVLSTESPYNTESNQSKKIALVLFSRTESHEASVRKLHPDQIINSQAIAIMIRHTAALLEQTDFDVIRITRQEGTEFGTRFTNTLKKAFGKGYDSVIIVGNDCPSLTTSDIEHTALKLQEGSNVIGPCKDGGIWLLGLQKEALKEFISAELPWQTDLLCTRIISLFDRLEYQYLCLDSRTDFDKPEDLITVLNETRGLLKLSLIKLLLSENESAVHISEKSAEDADWTEHFLRAPPMGC